jgi:16S rRNA C1402 (ribose-2'-O) methylase RsmI
MSRVSEYNKLVHEADVLAQEVSRRHKVLLSAFSIMAERVQISETRLATANDTLARARALLASEQRRDEEDGR